MINRDRHQLTKYGDTPLRVCPLFRRIIGVCPYFLFFLFLFIATACFGEAEEGFKHTAKSEHFIIYYDAAPVGYIDNLIVDAEKYYFSILDKLGFTRYDRFWAWENRCKIFIYSAKEGYNKKTGQPLWSEASVNVKQRVISAFLGRDNFKEILLPHEMAHLIFREYVGFKPSLPLWLDEGIACLQEPGNQVRIDSVKGFLKTDLFIPLQKLNDMRVEDIKLPMVFYAEATSVVDFMLKKYGKEKFVDFCRRIRDNTYWFDALKSVYGFKDLAQMNEEWINFSVNR